MTIDDRSGERIRRYAILSGFYRGPERFQPLRIRALRQFRGWRHNGLVVKLLRRRICSFRRTVRGTIRRLGRVRSARILNAHVFRGLLPLS
jgi:hypothetical protein